MRKLQQAKQILTKREYSFLMAEIEGMTSAIILWAIEHPKYEQD